MSTLWTIDILHYTFFARFRLRQFFRLSGYHPYAAHDSSEDEVKENILRQKCDPNLIHVQATQESLRFVTWALKKDPM